MSDRHVHPPYSLRLDPAVRTKLEEAAKRNKRSLSMEITSRLDTTIALDDFMAERKAGTYAEVYDMLQSVWADNDRLAENGEQTFGTAYAIIDKLLDEKLDELISKLRIENDDDTPSPTAKRRKKLTVLDTGVTHTPDLEIPTLVKPERRIRRREEDK